MALEQSSKADQRCLSSTVVPSLISTIEAPPIISETDSKPLPSEPGPDKLLPPLGGSSQTAAPLTPPEPDAHLDQGFKCEIQTLYEGPRKCQCCINWVEEYPQDPRAAVEEQADVKLKALIVRMRKNHDEGNPLVVDSIVVQSPSLKRTLGEVFEGYEGITADLKKLVFKSPFRQFYYRWPRFKQVLKRQEDEDPSALPFSRLLFDVLDVELHDVMAEVTDLIQHRVITYPLVWALFEPGKRIIATKDGDEQFLIVDKCTLGIDGCIVTAKYVDWDGECFGYADKHIKIPVFSGTQKITELVVFPTELYLSKEKAKVRALNRGLKFQTLRGLHYKLHLSGRGKVDGRIVLDAASYFEAHPTHLLPLNSTAAAPQICAKDYSNRHINNSDRFDINDRQCQMMSSRGPPLPTRETIETAHDLTKEQLVMCNPYVPGYSLKRKEWDEFRVQDIQDITWNDAAFPNLILPEGLKNLILAFVEGQLTNKEAFDDIIEGKGLGMIMLLVGNPGTGKTLTAEAVADKIRKPLYILSAGELGQGSSGVEAKLKEVLELTERWGAILLLDECDVFIQKRSIGGLAHNEIVAVFLRLLEYHRGILLMTSNRADTIDSAFHSRIHLTLHYPDLEPAAKDHLWRQFTARSRVESKITDEDFESLARLPLNGRQIKNVVKAATLLATHENTPLRLEQIRTVLQATKEVDPLPL